jgi:predicted ABC-type ATPase
MPAQRRARARGRLLVVVAGPNGAGKSTFVDVHIRPTGLLIVNPDDVARSLSPDQPDAVGYEAAQVADLWRRDLAVRGVPFCMETVFSDPRGAKLDFLEACQSQGYEILLVFIGLDGPELSRARVLQRVDAGGHDVPDEKLEARFPRTLANLKAAIGFVDRAVLFDNSTADQPFRFVAEFRRGKRTGRRGFRATWAAELE